MTSDIFKPWLDKLNSKFKSENRNILLYLENFSGHNRKDKTDHNYSNIKIHFYPPNCTSMIQPMDQGIIKTEKVNYKKNVVRRKLDSIEYRYEMEPITILDAIEYTDKAWREIKQSTIANCFRKAGYKLANQEESSEEIIQMLKEDDDVALNRKQYFDQPGKLITHNFYG